MTAIDITARENRANGTNYGMIWEALTSPIFRVVDEEGNNVADCRIRHFLGRHYLIVDDMDGYQVIDEDAAADLLLTEDRL